ncbi:MAG: hypothetical protein ABIT36_11945 [Steroidobacteraceae bacterium]
MQVTIFTTGGTIDKVYFDDQGGHAVGTPMVAQFLEHARVPVPVEVITHGTDTAPVHALPTDVCITANGLIFAANRVRKNRAANQFEPSDPAAE